MASFGFNFHDKQENSKELDKELKEIEKNIDIDNISTSNTNIVNNIPNKPIKKSFSFNFENSNSNNNSKSNQINTNLDIKDENDNTSNNVNEDPLEIMSQISKKLKKDNIPNNNTATKNALSILNKNLEEQEKALNIVSPEDVINNKTINIHNIEEKKPVRKSFGFDQAEELYINKNNVNGINGINLTGFVKEYDNKTGTNSENHVIFEGDKKNEPINKKEQISDDERKRIIFLSLREKVRNIKITEVAKKIGAHSGEDKIRSKWKMPWGHNVTIQGTQWFNHNSRFNQSGGNNALSFAQYIMSEEFGYDLDNEKEARKAIARAVYWLADEFNISVTETVDEDILAIKKDFEDRIRTRYSKPKKLTHYNEKVFKYLTEQRHLPAWIVKEHMEKNEIYASIPNQFLTYSKFVDQKKVIKEKDLFSLQDNEIYAVFIAGDDITGSCECRVIAKDGPFFEKGFTAGSHKKSINFMSIEIADLAQRKIALCEAAIDALSFKAMNPGITSISIGGVDNIDFTLKIMTEIIEHPTYSCVFAFDNDNAGNNFYNNVLDLYAKKTWPDLKENEQKLKIKELFDCGKLEKMIPENAKDWNEMLKNNPSLAFDLDSYENQKIIKKKVKTDKIKETLATDTLDLEIMKTAAFTKNLNNNINNIIVKKFSR